MEFPIEVDGDLLDICRDWHSGQWSAMYSVLSTGHIHDADKLRGLVSELRGLNRLDGDGPEHRDTVAGLLAKYDALADQLPDNED